MSSEPSPLTHAVQVEKLGKCYHIYGQPRDRLRQVFSRFTRRNYYRDFWALRDVSFSIERGQTVGILGPNGSGKSTLLQLICGTLTKTSGDLAVNGRIAALLELGAGFNPEFTGRENIYVNGAILGLQPKEIDARYEQILNFADIGDFVEQPVKTYSSGMFVRLAFSVAVNVDPEILIVDEALAVGDIKFQAKCFRKFEDFRNAGKTILFVSHSTEHIVRHCNHAILLHQGRLIEQGEPKEIANRYMDLVFGVARASTITEAAVPERQNRDDSQKLDIVESDLNIDEVGANALKTFISGGTPPAFETRNGYNSHEFRWGERSVEIMDYLLCTPAGENVNHAQVGEQVDVYVKVAFHKDVPRPIYGLIIKTVDGITVFGVNSKVWDGKATFVPRRAGETTVVHFRFQALVNAGDYMVGLGVAEEQVAGNVPLDRRYDSILLHVGGGGRSHGIVALPNQFEHIMAQS